MLLADLAEHERRAGIGKTQDRLGGLAQGADQTLTKRHQQHEDRERELQAYAPGYDPAPDGAAVARERDAEAEDHGEAEDAAEPLRERAGGGRRRRGRRGRGPDP